MARSVSNNATQLATYFGSGQFSQTVGDTARAFGGAVAARPDIGLTGAVPAAVAGGSAILGSTLGRTLAAPALLNLDLMAASDGLPFRGLSKGANILENSARGRASEARVLQEFGLTKNTTAVSTAEGSSIPDALTDFLSVEIKDAVRVTRTQQIRIQTDAARAAGRESMLITGEKTCISGPCSRAFDVIIRRSDLGPQ